MWNKIGQNLDPMSLISPLTEVETAYKYVRTAQNTMEAKKWAATIAFFILSKSVLYLTQTLLQMAQWLLLMLDYIKTFS